MTYADYPYTEKEGTCAYDEAKVIAKVDSFEHITPNDPASLKAALTSRPVSVAIESQSMTFNLYQSGVLNDPDCGTYLDHAVLAVGFGIENDQEYYLVKNSWGTNWGENGYVKIAIQDGEGICGIQKDAAYPTKSSKW
mmetsp:Transcript_44133/g.59827  ORF Transcript_44133/g.59827 Transcript_44133/m.59827 type:complete len:138 (+) Transcript_44133:385-798(+)